MSKKKTPKGKDIIPVKIYEDNPLVASKLLLKEIELLDKNEKYLGGRPNSSGDKNISLNLQDQFLVSLDKFF